MGKKRATWRLTNCIDLWKNVSFTTKLSGRKKCIRSALIGVRVVKTLLLPPTVQAKFCSNLIFQACLSVEMRHLPSYLDTNYDIMFLGLGDILDHFRKSTKPALCEFFSSWLGIGYSKKIHLKYIWICDWISTEFIYSNGQHPQWFIKATHRLGLRRPLKEIQYFAYMWLLGCQMVHPVSVD